VLIKETNKALLPHLTCGEFLRWYGLWLVMATTEGCFRRDFWSTTPVSMFHGAPYRFQEYMSRQRFDQILSNLKYTTLEASTTDMFWEVRGMITAWNENMAEKFRPGWINCLDESMSPWTNPWTCPGYMFVPRKPHPFGNEYHTVCCGVSRLMWAMELVEGKNSPHRHREFEDRGRKTVGMLLRLCKPFFYTGLCLVLDSGFCVLKGLIELC